MSIENNAPFAAIELDVPQPVDPYTTLEDTEPTSFIDLVLMASACSEDEGEVRDLVDRLLNSEGLKLRDLREDQIPSVASA